MGAILHAHPVCSESHIQRNANREVATLGEGWARLFQMTESERGK